MNHVLAPRVFHAFSGGEEGGWRVDRIRRITGDALPSVRRLDERRDIMEAQSRHISTGLAYLPGIARRLYHCRDIGGAEPFDFLTWFEFEPAQERAFDALLAFLRASREWTYVSREVDVRGVLD